LRLFRILAVCLLVFWWTLLPVDSASADEVTVNLDAQTAFVDIPVSVDTSTVYSITTQTGARFEVVNNQTVERLAWVDSWIELRQNDLVLRADDDGNHNAQTNYFASRITGTIPAGTYIIRATSYDYVVAQQRPVGTYTVNSNLIVVEPTPSPSTAPSNQLTPQPQPTESPSPTPTEQPATPSPTPQPTSEPTPSSSPSPQPSPIPTAQPEPTPQPSPSTTEPTPSPSATPSTEPTPTGETPNPNPNPQPVPNPNLEVPPYSDPEPLPIVPPVEEPVTRPDEILTETDLINPTPEQPPLEVIPDLVEEQPIPQEELPTIEEPFESQTTSEIIDDVLTDGQITPADAEAVVDSLMLDGVVTEAEMTTLIETLLEGSALTGAEEDLILDALSADGEITQTEVNNLSETLSKDGQFTEAERELVAEALIESAEGQAVTVEAIAEAGITLQDLPPAQPVEVRQDENGNEVVITAEVAVALELLTSAGDIVSAIFESPAQLLFAIGNLGADMSPEERKEASETIIAATIVGNIATTTMATAIGSVGYRRQK